MQHLSPAGLVLLIAFLGPILWAIRAAQKGKTFYIRRIPGIDALEYAVSSAVERGRPLSFTTGTASIGPLVYACLEVLRFLAQKAAVYRIKLFVPCSDPEVLALSEMTVRKAYEEKKVSNQFDPSTIRYLSDEQFAFSSGYMGLIHRENVGSTFLIGQFAAESLILAEAGQQIGAFQIGGTTSNEQLPFFVTTCDYTLIGEELFAAGAYLSREPVQTGSLRGQDIAKLILLILVLVGMLEETLRPMTGLPSYLQAFFKSSW
jgi:hypothetical protein